MVLPEIIRLGIGHPRIGLVIQIGQGTLQEMIGVL
jgi:hypothetical protein